MWSFEISLGLRAAAGAPTCVCPATEVDGLHVASTSIGVICLGVAIVEAAGVVVVSPVEDCINTLRVVTRSYAASCIVAVAGAGLDIDAVRLKKEESACSSIKGFWH